jgi:hypothetical protein
MGFGEATSKHTARGVANFLARVEIVLAAVEVDRAFVGRIVVKCNDPDGIDLDAACITVAGIGIDGRGIDGIIKRVGNGMRGAPS